MCALVWNMHVCAHVNVYTIHKVIKIRVNGRNPFTLILAEGTVPRRRGSVFKARGNILGFMAVVFHCNRI